MRILGANGVAPACLLIAGSTLAEARSRARRMAKWPTYAGDFGEHTLTSPLDQIKADNFNKLEVAPLALLRPTHWGRRPEYQFEGTPLMVKGVLLCHGPDLAVLS